MSELITRRTFLKTTGAAALAVAASGMLAGFGDGAYASTPENLVAPPIDNSDFANFGSFTADIGPLSGQWTSSSIYESDTRHNYFYTGFKLDNSSGTSAVTVNISNFAFKHSAGGTGKVCGLGYKGLNSSKTAYVFNQSITVPAGQPRNVILFIDIGPVTTSSFDKFYRGAITITLGKFNQQTATFTFNGLIGDPSSTVS